MQQNTTQESSPITYPADFDPSLNGIGGWLILFIIGQFASGLSGAISFISIITYLGSSDHHNIFLALYIIVGILVVIIGSIAILYCIFSRNILFRKLFIIQNVSLLLFSFLSYAYITPFGITYDLSRISSSIISTLIWLTYLYRSKRIRNTFIYNKRFKVQFGQKMINLR